MEHPFCAACDRRFISRAACDSHMAAKHPPTFDCVPCNRNFPALYALENHYRGSATHPNCAKCGRGFKDHVERDEHQTNMHPKVICPHCGVLMYEDSLEGHYIQSSDHPSCKQCSRGFKDGRTCAEHMTLGHPELRCEKCGQKFETVEALQIHYFASPMHPGGTFCNRSSKDDAEYNHLQSHQTLADVELESSVGHIGSSLVHGFSPRSPRTFKDLIGGDIRNDAAASPVLSLQIEYASPIKDVQTPLFSPAGLPRPGRIVEEVWTAHDNIQVPLSRAPKRPPHLTGVTEISSSPFARTPLGNDNIDEQLNRPLSYYSSFLPVLDTHSEQALSLNTQEMAPVDASTNRLFPPTTSWRARHPPVSAGSKQFSDNRAAGQHSTSVKYGLYAGSALSRFRLNSLLSPSTSEGKAPLESSLIHPFGRSIANWRQVMGDGDPLIKVDGETSVSDAISTQAVDTPVYKFAMFDSTSSPLDVDSLSPSSASLHGRSFSPWTTPLPNAGLSAASPSQNLPLCITSPTDPSHSSQSPEVFSPVGLAALPIVTPFASSPVDLDVRTHQRLSTASGVSGVQELMFESPKSPLHIALDTEPLDSPSIESLTYSQHSFRKITSPRDTNWDQAFQEDVLAVKLPDSPISELALSPQQRSQPAPYDHIGHDTTSTKSCVAHVDLDQIPGPASPAATGIPEDDTCPPSRGRSRTPPAVPYPRLHCRLCHSDPCANFTATMCGHMFCYKCITNEIIKNSCCPLCKTPMLLYCLFQLDLSV